MPEWLLNWLRSNMTDEQLEELRSTAFDRWNWDTNDPEDRKLFDAMEAEREQRNLPVLQTTLTFVGGAGIIITDEPNGGTITISVDEEAIATRVREQMKNGEL